MKTQVILLAAGQSTRTWPIAEKIFVKILGKTILEHQIETLLTAKLKNICIVGNQKNINCIQEICQEKFPEHHFSYAVQENLEEGIRGGILAAEAKVEKKSELLVVCSNDIVESSVFQKALQQKEKSDSSLFMVGKKMEKYFPGGYLEFSVDNFRITSIQEKPEEGRQPSDMVTLLIHLFRSAKQCFELLNQGKRGEDGYEDLLQDFFDAGQKAELVSYNGFWQAIKYPWHLLLVQNYFLSQIKEQQIHSEAQISENAIIRGNVVIAKDARVFDFAVIQGPVYIGERSIVANQALVRESIIGSDCVVGQGTEVARSLLQPHCWTHQNFVGDSVFGENVSLGAGTKTGNLRLDEKNITSTIKKEKVDTQTTKLGSIIGNNVRIGINSSLMPGIKIGENTLIGAQCLVDKDIPENTFKTQQKEVKNISPSPEKRKI